MVRFNVGYTVSGLISSATPFQSHNGSIQRRRVASTENSHSQFQSHNGSIQRIHASNIQGKIMVFQSHNGSIQRWGFNPNTSRPSWFQSHNGSIQRTPRGGRDGAASGVSIPQWFDSTINGSRLSIYRFLVSIPQWFDSTSRKAGEAGQ